MGAGHRSRAADAHRVGTGSGSGRRTAGTAGGSAGRSRPRRREGAGPRPHFHDPYAAYDAGAYDQALQRFVDLQVARPEDPRVQLDVGSARYQLRDWGEAEHSFAAAAAGADPKLRARALYNLGNTAYRQGKLEEAVARYQAALAADPDDADAKFNLEFVRDEIRRRMEEAKKRQEQQKNQPSQQNQQDQKDQQKSGGDQQQDQQQAGSQGDQGGADSDRDGLSDQVERNGANPTDPNNPDTDGDGRLDGQEDANHNGKVDPGETDPNRADAPESGAKQEQTAEGGQPADQGLTKEEAERYLQALGDDSPHPQVPEKMARAARRARTDKDW